MEPANIKKEALALWAMLTGWFAFIPAPEGRGAAVIAAAFILLLLAPLLFALAVVTATGVVLVRASKDA